MATSLSGKRVVVIGGSSGIGFAVARAALDDGAMVTIGSSHDDKVAAAAARLGNGAQGATLDVKDEDSVAKFFDGVGAIDHLVFTAGDWDSPLLSGQNIPTLDIAAMGGVFGVRFWGAVSSIKHALPHLAADGSITMTNGMIAHRPRKGAAIGSAMAGAVEHLTRALAVDLAPVRVNAVCPGAIVTEAWDAMMPAEGREERFAKMTGHQPLPRVGTPDEVAQAYLYLMRGGYTTGQVLVVSGGSSLV
jgi:NAD(P)-dependent dehydrogenase (short-subunit alcohol dehydrogenase family)